MKKIIILAAMISAIATLGACGTPCDAAADRIEAKNTKCEVESEEPAEGEGEGEEAECSEADGESATCTADCYEAAPCDAIFGSPDFDAAGEGFADFGACVADC
jgi:hypothetical protein